MANAINIAQDTQTFITLFVSLTTVLGIFTGIINKLFSKKLEPIENRLDKHEKEALEKDINFWRYHVVSFASELHNDVPKTKYEFEVIFKFIDEYEKAIEKLEIKNSLFETEEMYIREIYKNISTK